MVMPEEPVLESAAFPNLIEEVCQRISLVQSSTEGVLDTAGAAMGKRRSPAPPKEEQLTLLTEEEHFSDGSQTG